MSQWRPFLCLMAAAVLLAVCHSGSFAVSSEGTYQVPLGSDTWNPSIVQSPEPYIETIVLPDGRSIDKVTVPGRPPKNFRALAVHVPLANLAAGINVLSNVPAFDWSYGCSPTAAAMMMGHYDNGAYPDMYTGPTNGGVCPLTNSVWGTGECPLSATHDGIDGRVIYGHVDDYYRSYQNCDPDPFIGNWAEHAHGECTADFMGTNQSLFANCDGATTFYFYTDGSPLYDYISEEPDKRDGCHGLKLFVESCGYEVTTNHSQYIYGYNGNTLGFTFEDFQNEIDAGRPVLIQVTGHTMLGYGYDTVGSVVYIHDTWDYSDHQMIWGSTYSGLQHYGVTVIQMQPPTAGSVWYVDKNSPGPVHNGTSWISAFLTVQEGLNAALPGDEVWVAAATYVELVTLNLGVGLYGGFAGTETARNERNPIANPTIIDGNQGGTVVTPPRGATTTTRLDGFTVRNGYRDNAPSGGIDCNGSSPAISNNIITGNHGGYGGGIRCSASSPAISNNSITGNGADYNGGGICCISSFPAISNNSITGNAVNYRGGGISCSWSSPVISNNTITGNSAGWGGGIYCYSSSPRAVNNIVAFNSSGIYNELFQGGSPSLQSNCVYNPDGYDYSGLSAGTGDISADPRLVAFEYGEVHIQPDSPCIGAGDDSVVQAGWVDMDGQARIQGAHVDIGADESDGTSWGFAPIVVRVSPSGNDANDGYSWVAAKKTVQAGISAASAPGGEVWVAGGTYHERITLKNCVYLYGGFSGVESARSERNWTSHETVLDGDNGGRVVTCTDLGWRLSCIDGFTVRNGQGGIYCLNCSPAISNNTITANDTGAFGGAIYCVYSSPLISGNAVTGNTGTGIYSVGSSGSSPVISNNTVATNTGSAGGIYCRGNATISNNIITGNVGTSYGGGIYSKGLSLISSNTVAGNSAPDGGGICCEALDFRSPSLANNIVAFNSSGIYKVSGSDDPALRFNCVYNPGGYDYSGLSSGTGDILVDPLFVDRGAGDYHLSAASPCVDAGDDGATEAGWLDIDGQDRIMGMRVDIGADEVVAAATPAFSPDGGLYDQPQSVVVTCATDGATIHYTTDGSDPTLSDPTIASGSSLLISIPVTLKARAWRDGLAPSKFKVSEYVIAGTTVATPEFEPDGGAFSSAQSVTITCATVGATIHYTTNGIDPTESDAVVASGSSVLLEHTCTLKAKAWKSAMAPSGVKSAYYDIITVAAPTFSPDPGIYTTAQSVTIACVTEGATIHYTTNGADPTEADPTASAPVLVSASLTLKARAWKDGWMPSDVSAAEYTILNRLYVDKNAPGPTHNGASWQTAFLGIQAALDFASAGNEIWVASGTYPVNITLKSGVALYGGFAGSETLREQRNWTANPAILDGNQNGSVVTSPSGATATTVLDGFTVRNGSGTRRDSYYIGGGILCVGSSPTIRNNTIQQNQPSGTSFRMGGGVYCDSASSPIIANNTITGNTADMGGAINCDHGSSPTVSGNVITANTTTGALFGTILASNSSHPVITNNTIAGNAGGGIACQFASATIRNNIVAFNQSGIYRELWGGGSGTVTLRNNDVYGNTAYDYHGLCAGTGDISIDPQFVDRVGGNLRIQTASPCVDTGLDSAVGPDWLDADGQPRIQGMRVDIGAYEACAVATPDLNPVAGAYPAPLDVVVSCATEGAAIHFTTDGDDPTEGDPSVSSGSIIPVDISKVIKARAWKTGLAPSKTKTAEYEISGTTGQLATPTFTPDGGGYTRPQTITVTCANSGTSIRYTINGDDPTLSSTLYTVPIAISSTTTLKARAWKDGWNSSDVKSAVYTILSRVYVDKNAPGPAHDGLTWPTACQSVQQGLNLASPGNEVWVAKGTYAERIVTKSGVALYGGFVGTETVLSQRNWTANQTILDGGGGGRVVTVDADPSPSTRLDGFTVRNGNAGDDFGGGVYCWYSSPTLANNTITANTAVWGGGIFCSGFSGTITGNTISSNTASAGSGIHCSSCSSPTISNNTITGNGTTSSGGGIYFYNSAGLISGNTITGNGLNGSGGGVYCVSSSNVVTRNMISGNRASDGAGVQCYGSKSGSAPVITDNVITGNTATSTGGGIGCYASSAVIASNTLSGNNAPTAGGIYISNSAPCISDNIVAFGQSGILLVSGTPVLRNNNVYGNTSYNYSGVSPGTGDISLDPLFVNRSGGDYHLVANSPCINAGWNDAPGLPPTDMDGQVRIWAGTVDIGADEFCVPPVSLSSSRGLADGLWTASNAAIVAAKFEDFFYIEADDRSSGIQVKKTGHALEVGMRADVTGRVKTSTDGERYIDAATAIQNGSGNVDPLALINRGVGGGDWNYNASTGAGQKGVKNASGLNNIGLLITALGIVTYSETGIFYIDDGSALADDSGHTGIKVLGTVPDPDPVGKHVIVDGISSCFKATSPSTDLYRQIRATEVTVVE